MDQKVKEILLGSIQWIAAAIVSTALILLAAALLLWKTELSGIYLEFYTLICCGIGSLIAGFGGGYLNRKHGLLYGMGYGIIYLSVLLYLVFFVFHCSDFPSVFQPKWALCLVLSALSGSFSVNLRKE